MSPSELAGAISMRDKKAITRAPGVGPKVAQRLLVELKDKVPALGRGGEAGMMGGDGPLGESGSPQGSAAMDAISALVNLGYSQSQASGAVARAQSEAGEDAGARQLIRLGLKALAG
jgi:Holliday junction DNA helicase RuvA